MFDLERDEFEALTQMDCTYCGSKPYASGASCAGAKEEELSGEDFIYNGIDRIDPELGYITENVLPCCSRCNYMKGKLGLGDWLWQISAILPRLTALLTGRYPSDEYVLPTGNTVPRLGLEEATTRS